MIRNFHLENERTVSIDPSKELLDQPRKKSITGKLFDKVKPGKNSSDQTGKKTITGKLFDNIKTSNNTSNQTKEVLFTNSSLDKAGEMIQYKEAMWAQAIHPEEFDEKYKKARESYEAACRHDDKLVT